MQACDFRRSWFFFEVDHARATTITSKQPIPHNQVRIPLECWCRVTEADGESTQYVLTASCKTERVAVDENLWHDPNADFCVVSSADDFMIMKRWQQCDMRIERESPEMAAPTERQVGTARDAWTSHALDIEMVDARELTSDEQIVEAVLNKTPIVGRTEFDLGDGRRYLVEFPVKTINVSDQHLNYQIDTGPVLIPDPAIGHDCFIGNFRLAYIAHNCATWSAFIINVPTEIDGGARVHHYSKPLHLDCTNRMFALDG